MSKETCIIKSINVTRILEVLSQNLQTLFALSLPCSYVLERREKTFKEFLRAESIISLKNYFVFSFLLIITVHGTATTFHKKTCLSFLLPFFTAALIEKRKR